MLCDMGTGSGNMTLDGLCLPRFKLKRGSSRAFALSKGTSALASPGNKAAGTVVLILFSPLIVMLVAMLLVVVVPATLIGALFPAGRRKIRAQKHKWKNPLKLELDREFVAPGESAEGALRLDRVGALQRIAVHLVSEERASYTRGTDRYTDKHRVYDEQVFAMDLTDERVRSAGGLNGEDRPGEWVFTFSVPETAMHSFNARNNVVAWMLEVRRQYPESSEVAEDFGVMVYPIGVCEAVLKGDIAGPTPEGSGGAASSSHRRGM